MRCSTDVHPCALWCSRHVRDADCLGAAFLAAVICVLGGLIVAIRGEWLAGAVLIFILAPIGYGQHVALGMAIDYARGRD